jgi:hypothetical protein
MWKRTGVGVPVLDDVSVGLEHADVRAELVGECEKLRLGRDVSRNLMQYRGRVLEAKAMSPASEEGREQASKPVVRRDWTSSAP